MASASLPSMEVSLAPPSRSNVLSMFEQEHEQDGLRIGGGFKGMR